MSVYGNGYYGYSNGHDPESETYQIGYVRTEIIQPVYSTYVDQYEPVLLSEVKKIQHSPDYNHEPERVEEFTTNGQTEASRPHLQKHGPLAATIPEKTHGPSGGRHGIGHAKNKKEPYQPDAPWNDNYGDKHRQNEKPTRLAWGSPSDSFLSSKPKNHVGSHSKPANHIGRALVDYYGDKDHKHDDDSEPSSISPGKQARPTRPTGDPTSDSSIRSKPTNHVGPLSKPRGHTGAPVEYYGDKQHKYDSARQPSPINTGKQARTTHPTWSLPRDSSAASKLIDTFGSLSKPTKESGAPEEYMREYAKPTSAPTSPMSRPIAPASTWRKNPDTFSETINSNEAARRYKYNNHDVQSLPPEDDTGSIDSTEAAKMYGGVIFHG